MRALVVTHAGPFVGPSPLAARNIVWHKVRKDGGSDGRGVGFYFRNVTELLLFGVRGKNARPLAPGRKQVNLLGTRKREHSRKPDEQYELIEACSRGPFLELFARGTRARWSAWGNEANDSYQPTWNTYSNHSRSQLGLGYFTLLNEQIEQVG
jgi:N6-adenosine-specific RNA methylase IME4